MIAATGVMPSPVGHQHQWGLRIVQNDVAGRLGHIQNRARCCVFVQPPRDPTIRGTVDTANPLDGHPQRIAARSRRNPILARLTVTIELAPTLRARMTDEEMHAYGFRQGSFPVNVDYKIVDGVGKDVPTDGKASGEILLKGPWITASYHGIPAEELTDKFSDGYWRSGDVGTIDDNGFIKITDRLKDVIKSGGEWFSSIDMENAMVGHPKVAQAAVVGLEHPKWEERPFILLVLKDGEEITREENDEHLQQRFVKWQLP